MARRVGHGRDAAQVVAHDVNTGVHELIWLNGVLFCL